MKKIAIILGTRPEIIKMSPVVRVCQKRAIDFFILHTGQHYSYELDKKMFEDLKIPEPKYNLHIGGEPYRKQVGFMMRDMGEVLKKDRPDVVIVQGDTTSVLAGALAASKLGICIAHHEAGLRSHDFTMIEETNRVITDHISDHLFAPTKNALKNLTEEGIDKEKIHLTGNTIVDVIMQNIEIAKKKTIKLDELSLAPKKYILASAHRAENVDIKERLSGIMKGLDITSREFGIPVIMPLHPRTKSKLKEFNISIPTSVHCLDPVGFLDLLVLEKNALLIMTDSGGLQEEAFVLKVPCVTLRDNTERPETVELGVNIVSGVTPDGIFSAARLMLKKGMASLELGEPFGDGRAAERIIDILERLA